MKQLLLILILLFSYTVVTAQVDSTMNVQLNRQIQNKSSMNKSSGNTQPPSTANIQDNRKVKKMISTAGKGTIKTETVRTLPVAPISGTAPNNENRNTVQPSVLNGNNETINGAAKVPTP